ASDPQRDFTLESGKTVTLAPSAAGEDAELPELRLPAEALVRLVYGRLDPGHTPPVETRGVDLDELRRLFPGFRIPPPHRKDPPCGFPSRRAPSPPASPPAAIPSTPAWRSGTATKPGPRPCTAWRPTPSRCSSGSHRSASCASWPPARSLSAP